MISSPLLVGLIVVCWLGPALLIVFAVHRGRSDAEQQDRREMQTVLKGMRADVRKMDLDAREQGWRRPNWGGPEAYVQSQVTESSQEVMVLTSYAEASVTVGLDRDEGPEKRRCSLCQN